MAAYDICVMPGRADLSQSQPKPAGQLRLARIDPMSADTDDLVAKAGGAGIAVIASHGEKAVPRLDSQAARWKDFALREIAEPVLAKGFDGWVVDGTGPQIVNWAKALHTAHPDRWVFAADDTLQEPGMGLYVEAPGAEMAGKEGLIRQAAERGTPLLAVSNNVDNPSRLAAHLAEQKAVPFLTTEDRTGFSQAP